MCASIGRAIKRSATVSLPARVRILRKAPLVVLMGLAGVLVAGMAGMFDHASVIGSAPPSAMEHRTAMQGVHVYEGLGGGVSMQLFATSIEPAPGRVGAFLTWLKPVRLVADARLIIDGPTGERAIVTGKRCELAEDGNEIIFDRGARWERADLGKTYHCRRIVLDHDRQEVAFQGTVHLQGTATRTTWKPFDMVGFFSDFPPPATGATVRVDRPVVGSERG